ncbi:hypothetical protein LEN26_014549 [Aphanomyces euteiches]|nr:hypothetical protein AeMF1_021083 [Aphanomyces euteiches]KAH9106505.1 hypothetical protein LEN26_014549 [Aphanomyces euteiches]KAH9186707.1 hypothetical protein AeNC1_011314 [Aphanomyces euteiches]
MTRTQRLLKRYKICCPLAATHETQACSLLRSFRNWFPLTCMLLAPAKTKGKKVLKEKPSVTKEQAAAITAAATKRKQEQRAREKAEKDELLRVKKELEDQLDALLQRLLHPVVRHDILPPHVREAVVRNRQLAREGRELRKRLEELQEVVAILTKWTFSFKPHEPKPSMMETALLGHEECRNYGHMWLCEKSLRMALCAHPFGPFKGRVEDDIVSWPHVGEDINGTSLEALQLHSQCTVMGGYEAVADVESLRPFKSPTNIEVVDFVHPELIYCCGKYGPPRPSFLNPTALFRIKHRIVISMMDHCT